MKRVLFFHLIFLMFIPNLCFSQGTIKKSYCMSSSGSTSNLESLKRELLLNAKRLAVNEIFGEQIAAFTKVDNFTLTEDMVKSSSVGFVRVRGNPIYKNGSNFGEVCVTIEAYSTEDDRSKLRPVTISKKNCSSDRTLTTIQIKNHAKEQAIMSALIDYDKELETRSKGELLPLVHEVKYLESAFVPDTETYCAKFEGIIYPIEVLAYSSNMLPTSNVSPQLEAAVNINGEWDLQLLGTAMLSSNGRRSPTNNKAKIRVEINQKNSVINGAYIWSNACSKAKINGNRKGNQINLVMHYHGTCCRGAKMSFKGKIISSSNIMGEFEPIGLPPSGCNIWWAEAFWSKKKPE